MQAMPVPVPMHSAADREPTAEGWSIVRLAFPAGYRRPSLLTAQAGGFQNSWNNTS